MKLLLFSVLAFSALSSLVVWACLRVRRDEVTPDWLVDQERREWGSGKVDQVCWKWPVQR